MTDAELDELARQFVACTLPKREWTHEAHLAIGLWHVRRYGLEAAVPRLRSGITQLNESHGVVNSATGGYHESITRAYAELLAQFAARRPQRTAAECVTELFADELADRDALLRFYSPVRLQSRAARLGWVEPDLAPLAL